MINIVELLTILLYIRRYRVLNTRSKFILLHDYRLFTQNLHYIWKRIVNVLFVKQYTHSHRGNVSTGVWFELSTVPFPLPIKEIFAAKQLNFWRSGKYQRIAKPLFPDKTIDLNGIISK